MKRVFIVDYGTSNLLSVVRAFRHIGADVLLIDRAEDIVAAGHLVVPGVGAFGACIDAMNKLSFTAGVRDHIRAGKPFLGICVGMQMMFDSSEEFGSHAGLGAVAGTVRAISPIGKNGQPHRIPHIGWSSLTPTDSAVWSDTPLKDVTEDESFYFVHSFMGMPRNAGDLIAVTDYDGIPITAAVRVEQALGCQFHPEKSGPAGLRLLDNFVRS